MYNVSKQTLLMKVLCVAAFFGWGGLSVRADDVPSPTPADSKTPVAASPQRSDNTLDVSRQIDQLIQAKLDAAKIVPSSQTDDGEFVHRVYLDITGRIPTAEQAKKFLDSTDVRKREKLIDELLDSPAFGRNLATFWHNWMVMPNQPNLRVPPDSRGLHAWLVEGFNKNRGWNEMVAELISFEGSTSEKPEGVFYLYNGNNYARPRPNVMAASVSRLFMGTQIHCAECHDHPFRDKWTQKDFWGMAAFFSRMVDDPGTVSEDERGHSNTGAIVHEVVEMKPPRAVDVKSGDPPFIPPPPGAAIHIPVTSFRSVGKVIPAKFLDGSTGTIPDKAPFRPALGKWITSPENKLFSQSFVNRLWAQYFGRGFVNPIDDFDESNPASHPELLELLAKEFVASGFQPKHLVRCICNSQAYQRDSHPVAENKGDIALFSHMQLKILKPESLYDSLSSALELPDPVFVDDTLSSTLYTGVNEATPRDLFCYFFNTKDPAADASEFSNGIPQALVLMNARSVSQADADPHEDVIERLEKTNEKPDEIVEDLFLGALSRRPTAQEKRRCTEYVIKRNKKPDAYRDVLWSLLNRSEFTFCR